MRFVPFRWHRSLISQLFYTFVAGLVLSIGCILGADWLFSKEDSSVWSQRQLGTVADLIQRSLRYDPAKVPALVIALPSEMSWVFHNFTGDLKYRVLDGSGRAIIASDSGAPALTPPGRPFDPAIASFTLASGDEAFYVRTEPTVQGTTTYFIQVGISGRLSAFTQSIGTHLLAQYTVGFALGSAVLFSIAVYFTLRRVFKPLREVSIAAARIDTQNLSDRLSTRHIPSEFLPVLEAFNLTLDRLEKGYNVQRAFLAGAAHELKTPLALIRAQIDLEGTADRTILLHDLDLMARQINQLLHLAEASEPRNYSFELLDVDLVADDVVDYLRRLAEQRGVYVDVRGEAEIPALRADRGALFMLLKNLIENAIQHSPVGGIVAMTIEKHHLLIRDEGPGIEAADLPKLFTRFWRGSMRRHDGAGLGLSICQEIATAHKWRLFARSTGSGAEFGVTFND